jgi:hypothetical protein
VLIDLYKCHCSQNLSKKNRHVYMICEEGIKIVIAASIVSSERHIT